MSTKPRYGLLSLVMTACILTGVAVLGADDAKPSTVAVAQDGTVHVPAFDLPLSVYMSPEAKKSLLEQLLKSSSPAPATDFKKDFAQIREGVKLSMEPMRKRILERYPVDSREEVFSGVHTVVVTPKSGIVSVNRHRVLINLHGGGFAVGDASSIGLIESAPLAAMAKIEVVSIDYRQGPEFQFPAASEDVAGVYQALLKRYKPQDIGIYGCSAGGLLTAEAVAWFQKERLPAPGAIGIFCASADATWGGDAYFTVPPINGQPPLSPNTPPDYGEKYYYGDHDLKDPLMSPVVSPEMLAKFPPTLLITGTRAGELSAAVNTHAKLVKVGIEADLHVWDGMWHAFYFDADLPESRDAYEVMVKFFAKHLGRR
ncbi:MAG: alpha/beta hydrolase fold domain-containing protein [Acidobacteria bacterium]|nr:alpha/beta hydrolase fold domain-containing protein [Acidobacteriota bacterium]